jgi:predicted small lipoprotein YifL
MLSIKKIILTFTALICCLALAACGVNKTINQKYFPDAEFNTLIVSADAAMGRADWAKAISAYEEGIALKPKNTDIKLKLANAYERDGKLAQAFNTYQLILDDSQSTAETLKLVKSKQDKLGFKKDPIVPVVIDNPQSKQVTPVTELVIAPAQDVKDVPTTETPEPLPSKQVNIVEMEAEVQNFLNSWRDAWASKNLNRYYDHYVVTFAGDSKNTVAWRAQRKNKILVNKTIVVNLDNVVMTSIAHDQAEVGFIQTYQAGSYQDHGKKTLKLQKIDGRWQIVQETFKPI